MPPEPDLARVSSALPVEIFSVSALARSVRDLLEHRYPLLWVAGEISNCVRAKSGHLYFSLKDQTAQVRCVMFRNRGQYLDWEPREGLKVEVRALLTLYEARGDFQLNVEAMRRAGEGALFEAFSRLRDKLDKEGLFDAVHKKPLPIYPRRIGIVTSLQAAALRDALTTLARRNPSIPVIIYPAQVQGAGAIHFVIAFGFFLQAPRSSLQQRSLPRQDEMNATCSFCVAAAVPSRIFGRSTTKTWRARSTPVRFRS